MSSTNEKEVKRYKATCIQNEAFLDEDVDGVCVMLFDYSSLSSELQKVKQTLSALDSEIGKVGVDINCAKCNGEGVYPEHNDHSFDEEGNHDCSHCPVPVQCDDCRATGIDQVKAQLEVQRLRILVASRNVELDRVKQENEELKEISSGLVWFANTYGSNHLVYAREYINRLTALSKSTNK